MPTSKARRQAGWPPLTVSRPQLMTRGTDDDFRHLVDDMVQFAGVLQNIRAGLARHMGISPPQYSMVMYLARCDDCECTTSQLARALSVTLAFIVTETSKLSRMGLVVRRQNPADARSVLIALTPKGRAALTTAAPRIREVNDRLFASLSREGMRALAQANAALLESSESALALLEAS